MVNRRGERGPGSFRGFWTREQLKGLKYVLRDVLGLSEEDAVELMVNEIV